MHASAATGVEARPVTADGWASGYMAHVDGLRAFAVLAVILYHLDARLIPGGFVGVDVFFVISGFVVTASLADHRSETLRHFLGRFYARRLARLIPALLLMLLTATLLYVLFVPKTWANRAADSTGLFAFWGLSNWSLDRQVVDYFDVRAELNPFTHTWSLGVEEQFYLLCPWLLFFALGARFDPRFRDRATSAIALLALLSLLACYYFAVTRGPRFVFFQIGFRFWELAAGVLLYLAGPRVLRLLRRFPLLAATGGGIGLAAVICAMLVPNPSAYPWLRSSVAVAGTLFLLAAPATRPSDPVARALSQPAAIWTGLRSYSLYLWHWPIFVIAGWTTGLKIWPLKLTAIALTILIASASYRYFELPIRYDKRLASQRPAVRIGVFLLAIVLSWSVAKALISHQPSIGLSQVTRNAADWYADRDLVGSTLAAARRCAPKDADGPTTGSKARLATFDPAHCAERSPQQLIVIGDSHARALFPLLEQISAEQGRVIKVINYPGCPFVDFISPGDAASNPACSRAHEAMLTEAREHIKPGDVVLLSSLRLPRLLEMGGHTRRGSTEPYTRTPAELTEIAAATRDSQRWIDSLINAGARVVVTLPLPIFRVHPFQCVDWFNRHHPDCEAGLVEQRADQERYRAPTISAIRKATMNRTEVSIWDPFPELCELDVCSALRGGRPLFFDGDHLSPYANLVLLPSFRAMLDQVIAAPKAGS